MRGLPWYNKLQFSAMILMAAAMPVDYHVGLWMAFAVAVATVTKIVTERKVGNPMLDRPLRISLYAVVVYVLVHMASLLLGGDNAVGFRVLELKGVLLIFPLCFLLSDTAYLTASRLRWLGASLLASVVTMFLYHMAAALLHMAHGTSFDSVFSNTFDPIHHAYAALYFVCALCFVYLELSTRWKRLAHLRRWLLAISAPLIVIDVVIVDSRAGMLTMLISAALCSLHLWVTHRSWWKGVLLGLLFLGFTVSMESAFHGDDNRLLSTFRDVTGDDPSDARVDINRSTISLAIHQPIVGQGVNNYRNELVDEYARNGYDYGAKSMFNAHNQYMETLLSTGLFGFVALLAFLLAPLVVAIATRRMVFPTLLLTLVVCVNLLFESMLERQMGLLFIGFAYAVVVLTISREENKFGRVRKK